MEELPQVLEALQLPTVLRERLRVTSTSTQKKKAGAAETSPTAATNNNSKGSNNNSFVLYLPTVNLRLQHNPALALACRLANHHQLPLLILAVVLDDSHLTTTTTHQPQSAPPHAAKTIVATARRTAFVLQAYQSVLPEWHHQLGAGVCLRVHHADGGRTPHHLTLARRAAVVVLDEPFVDPYRSLVEKVERLVPSIDCVRVDGSTSVPPAMMLMRRNNNNNQTTAALPLKAWRWEQVTKPHRKRHVYGAVRDGDLDAPKLHISCPRNILEQSNNNNPLRPFLPTDWFDPTTAAPGKRAWHLDELQQCNVVEWVQQQAPNVLDQSVPVCPQTHGGAGAARWKRFRQNRLKQYARRRNDIRQPHAVSRMSCYLNVGTVSIFQILFDLFEEHRSTDTTKFQDEIIKWREIGYAHAWAHREYFGPSVVPSWARQHIIVQQQCAAATSTTTHTATYPLEDLAAARTGDPVWDAMQGYLVDTGELHNNARMTWGKTLVEWQKAAGSVDLVLHHLAYLNDRYALDGLSPPSYAGLLWCLGWGSSDKPGGSIIATKPASRYRVGPEGFALAQSRLLEGLSSDEKDEASKPPAKKKAKRTTPRTSPKNQITSYFQKAVG